MWPPIDIPLSNQRGIQICPTINLLRLEILPQGDLHITIRLTFCRQAPPLPIRIAFPALGAAAHPRYRPITLWPTSCASHDESERIVRRERRGAAAFGPRQTVGMGCRPPDFSRRHRAVAPSCAAIDESICRTAARSSGGGCSMSVRRRLGQRGGRCPDSAGNTVNSRKKLITGDRYVF